MQLYQVLEKLAHWLGSNLALTRLTNAQSNDCYKVESTRGNFALRLNNPDAAKLGISRQREQQLLTSLASQAFMPMVLSCCDHWLLTRWLIGRQPRPAIESDFTQLLTLLARLHSLQVPDLGLAPIDIGQQINHLLEQCKPLVPIQLQEDIAAFIKPYALPQQQVLCFHDWHAGNVQMTNDGLVLLDWEYAAAGDPVIDLACFAKGFKLELTATEQLLERFQISEVAFARAMALVELMNVLWYGARFRPSDLPHRLAHSVKEPLKNVSEAASARQK